MITGFPPTRPSCNTGLSKALIPAKAEWIENCMLHAHDAGQNKHKARAHFLTAIHLIQAATIAFFQFLLLPVYLCIGIGKAISQFQFSKMHEYGAAALLHSLQNLAFSIITFNLAAIAIFSASTALNVYFRKPDNSSEPLIANGDSTITSNDENSPETFGAIPELENLDDPEDFEVIDYKFDEFIELAPGGIPIDPNVFKHWDEQIKLELDDLPLSRPSSPGSKSTSAEGSEVDAADLSDDDQLTSKLSTSQLKQNIIVYQGPSSFIATLSKALTNTNLQDSTPIAFTEDGIVPLDIEKSQSTIHPSQILQVILQKTYGERLAQEALDYYGISQNAPLTLHDLKSLVISIGVRVTREDLELVFNDCKRNGAPELLCSRILNSNERARLQKAHSFDDLQYEDIALLLTTFRRLVSSDHIIDSFSACFSYGFPQKGTKLYEDSRLFTRFENFTLPDFKHLNPALTSLAISEYLSQELAYALPKKGMIFPCIDENKKPTFYEVCANRGQKKETVVTFISRPLITQGYDASNPIPLNLTFRGTNNIQCWYDNMDSDGIGHTAFHDKKDELIAMIDDALQEQTTPTCLRISGHSLGGVLSQRMTVAVAEKIDSIEESSVWNQIQVVKITGHHSPHLENDQEFGNIPTNDIFKNVLKSLENKKHKLTIEANYHCYHDQNGTQDIVQWFGDVYLGAQIESPLLKTHVFKAKQQINKWLNTLQFHNGKSMNHQEHFVTYPIDHDEKDKMLANNFHWSQEEATRLNELIWHSTNAARIVGNMMHKIIDKGVIRNLKRVTP